MLENEKPVMMTTDTYTPMRNLDGRRFYQLNLQDWKQFENISIDFHPQLTILTGANGSGKTTIINILARHFGWSSTELATPRRNEQGKFSYFTRHYRRQFDINTQEIIGSLFYSELDQLFSSIITIPYESSVQYNPSISNQQYVRGLSIPSHRGVYFYQSVSSISTQKRTRDDAYNLSRQSIISRYNNQGGQTTSYYIKETLLNWAIGGSGNEFVDADPELKSFFLGFQDTLKIMLPKSLGFGAITIRNFEVVLVTETGDFILDAASGGISALIDLSWQIYNFYIQKNQQCVVIIDEVENHLHATMQRSVLPDLIKAFPNIQFIVSTHSPLIVGSVRNSNVYALRYDQGKKVYSDLLDIEKKAKTASEVLDEVLGVPFTMPIWVETILVSLSDKYLNQEITPDTFTNMRSELAVLGLEELMPIVLDDFLRKKNG